MLIIAWFWKDKQLLVGKALLYFKANWAICRMYAFNTMDFKQTAMKRELIKQEKNGKEKLSFT